MSGFGFTKDGKISMNTFTDSKKLGLSVVILTYNSEKHLKEVIGSALFADEVLVLDSGSDDKTIEIAKSLGARVEFQKQWLGFGKQKQKAVLLAKNEWVFVLDSDEIITDELKQEIIKTLQKKEYMGYFVARLNYFFGKPIRRCGLYPDYSIRLFNKNAGRFNDNQVHESVVLDTKAGCLKNHMLHYAYDTIEQFIDKQNRYSTLNAKPNILKALINPYWTFFKLYFLKLGFLEGYRGFIVSKLYSQYTFWKYIKGT